MTHKVEAKIFRDGKWAVIHVAEIDIPEGADEEPYISELEKQVRKDNSLSEDKKIIFTVL